MEDKVMLARINKSYVPAYWDDFFNDKVFNNYTNGYRKFTAPSVNIIEDVKDFKIEFAVPGLAKEDFNIDLEKDLLTISYGYNAHSEDIENGDNNKSNKKSESNEAKVETTGSYLMREFNFSSFKRSFRMPETVDSENIAATYRDGILSVSIPKKEEVFSKAQKSIEIS